MGIIWLILIVVGAIILTILATPKVPPEKVELGWMKMPVLSSHTTEKDDWKFLPKRGFIIACRKFSQADQNVMGCSEIRVGYSGIYDNAHWGNDPRGPYAALFVIQDVLMFWGADSGFWEIFARKLGPDKKYDPTGALVHFRVKEQYLHTGQPISITDLYVAGYINPTILPTLRP